MTQKIILVLIVCIVGIQFIRPSKNQHANSSPNKHLFALCPPPIPVYQILEKSCLDCHSDSTSSYYWYSNIQPIGWWIAWHINTGKEELNFSTFLDYPGKKQARKLRKINTAIQKNSMPLKSYTWTHKNAILTEEEKMAVAQWVDSCLSKIDSTTNHKKSDEIKH